MSGPKSTTKKCKKRFTKNKDIKDHNLQYGSNEQGYDRYTCTSEESTNIYSATKSKGGLT